jgi:hypothetical protein
VKVGWKVRRRIMNGGTTVLLVDVGVVARNVAWFGGSVNVNNGGVIL